MPRFLNKTTLVLASVIMVVGIVGGLFATSTLTLRQDKTEQIPAPTALPATGDIVTLYANDGSAWIQFQTSDYEPDITPYDNLDIVRTRVRLTIKVVGAAVAHIRPNNSIAFIDSWGAYRSAVVIDDADHVADSMSFDLKSGEERTIGLRLDLPSTDNPALLIWNGIDRFAVLSAFDGVIAGAGEEILKAALPTYQSAWIAVPGGNLTVSKLESAAKTTSRGAKLWREDHQFASVAITFQNTQSGRIMWSPDSVTIVDQLGRSYRSYVNAARPSGTPAVAEADPALIPAGSTVQLTLGYEVPLGTDIRYVVIAEGGSMSVVATVPTGDANMVYNDNLVRMLQKASASCAPYADWSARAHAALGQIDTLLTLDLGISATMTPGELRARAQVLRSTGSDLESRDTYEQSGFSESVWLKSVLTQTADTLVSAADARDTDPGITWSVDPGQVATLFGIRDQFATRLAGMDSFFSTGCGDIVNPAASQAASPVASPESSALA
jgi:hypothetical protein